MTLDKLFIKVFFTAILSLLIFSNYVEADSSEATKVTVRCGEHQGDSSDGCSFYGQINDGTGSTDINDWGQKDYSVIGQTVKVSVQRDGSGGNVGYYLEIWIYAGTNEVAYSICKHDNSCSTDATYSSTALGNVTNNAGTFVVLFTILLIGGFVIYNYKFKVKKLYGFEEKSTSLNPPIPPDGLPEGWTIEQWKHYGNEYLEKKSRQNKSEKVEWK